MDGLTHDYLKMKVMKENPAALQAAVASAMNEQNLMNIFNLKIGRVTESNVPSIEPMEIDHLRPKNLVFKCNKIGHYSRDCHIRSYVNNAVNSIGQHIELMDVDYAQSPKLCFIRNHLGNLAKDCFNKSLINAVLANYPTQLSK